MPNLDDARARVATLMPELRADLAPRLRVE